MNDIHRHILLRIRDTTLPLRQIAQHKPFLFSKAETERSLYYLQTQNT
jgi:hypothetical protein